MQLTTVTQMTSLEVAEITGKEHKSVLRDIRDEIEKLTSQGILCRVNIKIELEEHYQCMS